MNLKGKHILITAGPTREYIDPVRFISNESSGAMGLALASAAKKMGARVTLICGPVNPPQPPFCKGGRGGILNVVSAREMYAAVKKHYRRADIIICAAAVADWRPVRYSRRKIKKVGDPLTPALSPWGRGGHSIKLIQNPDILAWLGRNKKKKQCLIGFALETENVVKNAIKKLNAKRCDIIVANHASAIGAQRTSATMISRDGIKRAFANGTKQFIAREILKTGEKWTQSFFQGSNLR